MQRLLPPSLYSALTKLDINKLEEIRIRRNAPIIARVNGENKILGYESGEKIYAASRDIDYILKQATENSLYAYNSQIKQGFITARGGIRIGIAGESVNSDNFMPTTLKNINSLVIRVPHEVKGCSNKVFKFIASDEGIKNTLIIAPPGAGKTTLLRDIASKISTLNRIYNCLVVDERFEIASCVDGTAMLDVGKYTDIVSGATKKYAFSSGIRTLRPDVVLTDELMTRDDADACVFAVLSGVKVIATIHANNHFEIMEKDEFSRLLKEKIFERIIVLSCKNGVGIVEAIYDENLKNIYF